ncbi:MAG: hypothetical protein SFV15_16770 [Polyangiaceae bacterium]|nr:hypothetical protein [Polyangiaceae bacterium]
MNPTQNTAKKHPTPPAEAPAELHERWRHHIDNLEGAHESLTRLRASLSDVMGLANGDDSEFHEALEAACKGAYEAFTFVDILRGDFAPKGGAQ